MNKRRIAEKIYQTLTSLKFEKWSLDELETHLYGPLMPDEAVDKETILTWIEQNMVDDEQLLTEREQNVIKDILRTIGRDVTMDKQFAKTLGLTLTEFDILADSILNKLGNGKVSTTGGNKM